MKGRNADADAMANGSQMSATGNCALEVSGHHGPWRVAVCPIPVHSCPW